MAGITGETNETDESKKSPPAANGDGPTIPEWVNEEHFIDVVEENVEGFKRILKFDAALTGGAGENYASIMIRVKVNVELRDGSTRDLAYMIKSLPQSERGAIMIGTLGLFPKESEMYGEYLPEFEQMYRDVGKEVKFGPKFYRFKKNPGVEYVLLEDLCPQGFKNVNRLKGLDKEHTESVLKMLAELHAASAVRYETRGEYNKRFTESIFNEDNREMLETMGKSIEIIFQKCVSKYTNCSMLADRVKLLQSQMTELYITYGVFNPSEFNVLNHGDLWANNIMFRHNDEGKREATIFVDFQISRYGSVALDLYYFLMSSTSLDLKLSHFDYFIKYYYDYLVENLKLLGYPKSAPTLKELRIQLLQNSFWAFATISGVMAAVLLDPNENANFDNFVDEGAAGNDFKTLMYSNPRYVEHMEAILPWMDIRGLFD